jgi:predicted P-loop ATPase
MQPTLPSAIPPTPKPPFRIKHDKKLLIATGRSRKAALWQNKEMLWSALVEKLAMPTRTRETIAEFMAISKNERDTIKDVGGFVGGYLKNGKRSAHTVVNRCLVCLDADHADEGLFDDLAQTFINAYALYSTHSHTKEKMRVRIIIPLSRTVTPDEFAAISRRVADDLTLSRFDPTTFEPSRLMYWPSVSEDGDFVFDYQDAPFLDPDEVLATYADWRDTSLWPTTKPLEERTRASIGKQEDPLKKRGLIGAYCRAHTIHDVLDTVLKDRYTPMAGIYGDDSRYSLVGGSTAGGLVTYDDKFAFSHHATDPAGGQLCNAFDLVRLHLFTPGKDDAEGNFIADDKASRKAMMDYASRDEGTRRQLAEERFKEAEADFAELPGDENANAQSGDAKTNTLASPTTRPVPANLITPIDPDWQMKLEYDRRGKLINSLRNLVLILQNDTHLRGIVFNQHSDGMEIRDDIAPVTWQHPSKYWRGADDAQLTYYIESHYGMFTQRSYDIAVTKVTDDRSYHPIHEYLAALPTWDGMPRVDTLLIDYLAADDNAYVRAVTRKILCAAIARVQRPGIKFDSMLVLSGPQGVGKSTLIAKLGGEWFSDSMNLSDTRDKTAAEKLQGIWILEIGELAGLRKAEVETLRSFLSRQNDIYRASFGKRAEPHQRQCVFFGTTNERNYLRDATGNRRFWPVQVPGHADDSGGKHSWQLTTKDVEQIWAEALILTAKGEKLYLEGQVADVAREEQREAMETDEREGIVREYLEKLLPENWADMKVEERRGFLRGDEFLGGNQPGTVRRKSVCALEIWCECFGRDAGAIKRTDTYDIFSILTRIGGWQRARTNSVGSRKVPLYGLQRCFDRIEPMERR